MPKLWEKGKGRTLDRSVESFETESDIELDQKLAEFDVYCSLAHVKMLNRIGLLADSELALVKGDLLSALSLIKSGKFGLKAGDEDIHTKIENFVTSRHSAGKKMHTGRSRNDQVLTDLRLYTKESLLKIWGESILLAEAFTAFAKKYEFLPMPGYTHMQKAMPSSLGLWSASFAEALLDDLTIIKVAYELNNSSPLGSAASYGVPLALDREYTAKLLGFGAVQKNSLYCQNSRGKIESLSIAAMNALLLDINKFSSDVMLFTTSEFGYFVIDKRLCSGSSIMPQKRNVDIAELLRSKVHVGLGYYTTSLGIASNLFSGYNRDLQDGKMPLMKSLENTLESVRMAHLLLDGIQPNGKKMRESMTPEIFATHNAMRMVLKGKRFREAYRIAGDSPEGYLPKDLAAVLKDSEHIGGTGKLLLSSYEKRIKEEKRVLARNRSDFRKSIALLIKG